MIEVKSQSVKNATGEKTLRKELVEVKRQRRINVVDEQVLGKETKVHSKSRLRNNKTQDKIQQQHVEEGKVDFKADSKINSETERKRQNFPEKNQTFLSRINKVIEIKDEPLPKGVTKTIHLKEDPLEKKFINSENSKEEAIRKGYPLRSKKTESKTVNLVTKAFNTFNYTAVMKDANKTTCDQRYQYQHGENISKKYSSKDTF